MLGRERKGAEVQMFGAPNADDPTSDEVKEVYARFGLAYYVAECIHRGLCNLYVFLMMPAQGPITRPRVEEHIRISFSLTLGNVVRVVADRIPGELSRDLRQALDHRNFLAHNFWYERVHLFGKRSGIAEMLDELDSYIKEFSALDKRIESLLQPHLERMGATPDLLAECMRNLSEGKVEEPLNQQRKIRQVETITGAYLAPAGSANTLLVFQSDDGVILELCDVGLGWSSYSTIGDDWVPVSKLKHHLPARVVSRPTTHAPWEYELSFDKAVLSVRPGSRKGEICYKIRPATWATEDRQQAEHVDSSSHGKREPRGNQAGKNNR